MFVILVLSAIGQVIHIIYRLNYSVFLKSLYAISIEIMALGLFFLQLDILKAFMSISLNKTINIAPMQYGAVLLFICCVIPGLPGLINIQVTGFLQLWAYVSVIILLLFASLLDFGAAFYMLKTVRTMQAAFRDLKGNKQDAQMIESQRNFDGLRFWTCVTILNDAIALGLFLTGYVLRSMNDGISTVASYSIDIMSIALMGLQPCINRATYLQTLKCSLKTNISLTVKTSDVITEDGRNQTNKGSEHFSPDASSSAASGKGAVDRIAKELKAQREYKMKWECLNDARLYSGEKAPRYPQKQQPTKWSHFSVINPPARDPTPIKVQQLPFKITGARDHYRDPKKKQSPDPLMLDASLFEKKFQRAPTQTYRYPVTSNMEYGWGWKKNLS